MAKHCRIWDIPDQRMIHVEDPEEEGAMLIAIQRLTSTEREKFNLVQSQRRHLGM